MNFTIFCSVVDNFGDIGICWRLARQLAAKQHAVCLYVDDLVSFSRICSEVQLDLPWQQVQQVDIVPWAHDQVELPKTCPDVLIEAFACQIPNAYLQWCDRQTTPPLWLNLEYLTAEAWAASCHGLPSPQAGLSMQKYFFFPGFTEQFGGLLREPEVLAEALELKQQPDKQQQFWQRIGIADAMTFTQKISLFAYSQAGIAEWFNLLAQDPKHTLVLVPEGALATSLKRQYPALTSGRWVKGHVSVQIIPFVSQPDYDRLLACCDLNFVRGEDSIIRAHWAGRPFIWQIYRQEQQAHLEKLLAFLQLMLADAPEPVSSLIYRLHEAWEQEVDFAGVWPLLQQQWQQIASYTEQWQQKLLQQEDLVTNLVRFVKIKHIIPRTFS